MTTRIRTSPDIIELHRTLTRAMRTADQLATHADTIGDLTFAYWIGQAWMGAANGLEALNRAREVPQ